MVNVQQEVEGVTVTHTRVELFKGEGLQPWFLRLMSAENKTFAISGGYFSKWNAKRAAKRNFRNIPLVEVDA